jgi:DNA gyrase subunit A
MKIGVKALNLDEGDEICSILLMNDERVGMLTARGQFVMCETKDIRAIGRIARGVKGITLNPGDSLVSAQIIPSNVKELLTISELGFSKRTSISEFNVTGRATKGVKIQTLKENDSMIDFAPIVNQRDTIVVSSNSQIKFNIEEINLLSKGAQGTKSIKLNVAKVIGLQIF